MFRVSGLFFGVPFTGVIRVPDDTGVPIVKFDSPLKAEGFPGCAQERIGVWANESESILRGLHFHERTRVCLGEFLLGYLVLKRNEGMSWFAEPINHAHHNILGVPGLQTSAYETYLGAYGFFHESLPHPCRSSLRCHDQRVEFDFFPGSKRA